MAAGPAGLPRDGSRERHRRRRNGQDHRRRQIRRRLRSSHLPHPRNRREPADSRGHPPALRRRPARAHTRHARAAPRQGVRLPARDAAGADGRQSAALGAHCVRLHDGDHRVARRPAAEGAFVRGVGRAESGRTLYDLCFGTTPRVSGGCPLPRSPRSRRSGSPNSTSRTSCCARWGSKRIPPRTSPSTCIRARASACCSRTWRTSFAGPGTACASSHPSSASSGTATGSRVSCSSTEGAKRRSTATVSCRRCRSRSWSG